MADVFTKEFTKDLARRKKNLWIFAKIVENQTLVPIIGLLLQIHDTKCILHTYSSTIEILEN
jgi:hypothetical protein